MSPEWESYGEWTRALVRATVGGAVDGRLEHMVERLRGDSVIEVRAALTGAELWDGGALVPETMLPELRVDPLVSNPLRERVSSWPMTSAIQGFPYVFDNDHSSDAPYGMQYRWEGDADTAIRPETGITFARGVARAKTLEAYLPVEYPLAMDSTPGFMSAINRVAAAVYSWVLDKHIIRGAGPHQMRGILGHPATIVVSRSAANQIGDQDLDAMEARLLPACAERAVFLAHPAAIGEMIDRVGGRGLQANIAQRNVNGFRVLSKEHCSALGTAGDLILADLAAYQLFDRMALTVELSSLGPEVFSRYRTLVRAIARLDGQPGLSEPITPSESTDTLSAFVVLGAP